MALIFGNYDKVHFIFIPFEVFRIKFYFKM